MKYKENTYQEEPCEYIGVKTCICMCNWHMQHITDAPSDVMQIAI
jgi:hypothetical protein